MSIPGAASPLFLSTAAGGAAAGYAINRSLRFNSSDSSFLSRTPSSAGNRTTWTWAGWVKKSGNGAYQGLFTAARSGYETLLMFDNSDRLHFYNWVSNAFAGRKITTAVFRDPSAWYHIVCTWDSTNVTAADRCRLYVNGVRLTTFDTSTDPTSSEQTTLNDAYENQIGNYADNANYDLNGYLADVHFIEQALDPTDFGEYDDNNVWQPKAYAGTYGTNGFHLDFSDGADLGNDSSGNNNDWTPNNLVGQLQTGDQGMDVITYTGNGGTQSISGLQFQPDLLWLKARNQSYYHILVDSVRGNTKEIYSNDTTAEQTTTNTVTAFNSNGFSLGNRANTNQNSATYVAWAWKAGGAAVSNTDGSITSQVSANQTYGFSIVTYTAPASNTFTVGHGLNAVPELILVKGRNQAYNWDVYHKSLGATKRLMLNLANAAETTSGPWNNTTPTSSVFSSSGNGVWYNSGDTLVAYCWSEVAGYSKIGSYIGNGSSTGPVVTTGFKLRYLLIKRTDTSGNWIIYDSARDTTNPREIRIVANNSNAEVTTAAAGFNFLLDGFQAADSNVDINASGGTYIYMAFAAGGDGADLDSLLDTPEQRSDQTDSGSGGDVVGNYATLNPLDANSEASFANGNLDWTATNGGGVCRGTIAVSSGKWYFEFTYNGKPSGGGTGFGILEVSEARDFIGGSNAPDGYSYYSEGSGFTKKYNGGTVTDYGDSFEPGDIIGVALDLDGGTITFYKNGTSQGQAFSGISGIYAPALTSGTSVGTARATFNAGQRAFAYAAPTNYKALCTANLSDPTIAASTAFDTKLYTGTGSTQTISGLNFSPDLVWIKDRSLSSDHALFDVVRGSTTRLRSNQTDAESTDSGYVTSFNSDGFSVGSHPAVNYNTSSFVAWAWDGGSSTVTNTDGSISSQVRANQSAGFSIVSFTPASSGAFTVGHGLNATPSLVIAKARNRSVSWFVYSNSLSSPLGKFLELNSAAAVDSNYANFWGTTAFSSTVFGMNTGVSCLSTDNMIAYCFAPVEGYSAFGSYTGNGSTDGPFVYTGTGFRPRWIMFKRSDSTADWFIFDTSRPGYNLINLYLMPNNSSAENTDAALDIVSNGFKWRSSAASINGSGATYIYAAFAEHPFRSSRAR